MKKIIFALLILAFAMTNCKKTKLSGDNSKFVGTWRWYGGWSDNASTNFKLEISEKGKFKLFNSSDKIDYGRLLDKDGKLTFISDKPRNKGYFADNEHQLSFYNTDTIGIGHEGYRDYPSSGYVRE
jgi:hypothetical protein